MKKTYTYLFTLIFVSVLMSSNIYAQCGSGQSSIDIYIDFTNDNFPDEDGWKIVNTTTGVAIDSACFGDYASGNNTTITLCLDTGITYSLYALDDYGDGLDGSEYQLAYTYGSGIDTIGANNFNISFTHCNPFYTNNEIADSTSFYVAYVAPPNCLAPDSLAVSGITSTSADINWRDYNSATQWQIQFDTVGFTLGNGKDSIANSIPKTITGLTPDTKYEYYVRAICGVGDTSSWSTMGSFKTAFVCPTGAVCATYTSGDIQTDRSFTALPGTSTCAASLSVTIPAGNRIDSITTRYDMTAFVAPNNAWLSEQRSWLYSVDANAGEATITNGIGNTDGTLSYLRSGISIANGYTGTANFELHAGRSFGGTGCTSDYSVVDSATWIVIAYYSLAPACLSPLSVNTTAITSDSAQLNWAGTGTANQWIVEWDTAGFTAGTGTNSVVVSTDTFTTITGLVELSTYEYYVRAICGAADTSSYSLMGTVSTPCDPSVAPFLESFDNTSLPTCWSQSATSGGPWIFGTPGFSWNNTGCSGSTPSDHTGNSGNYAAMDHSGVDDGVILEMPSVDISALTTPFLEFYFTMCGSGYTPLNLLHIEAYNGTGWDSVSVIQQGTNGWELFGFDISSFTFSTDFVKIRFRAESGGSGDDFYGDNAIDDVSIDEAPTCPNPSNQITSNITSNSVDLDWSENGSATDWQIEYDTSGFTQGSGNDSIVTSKPFSWTGLSSNTTYSWYVRAICGAGDTSGWVGPISFTTDCPATFAIPYVESFDSFVPGCWEQAGSGNPATGPIDSTSSNWSGDDYLNSGIDGLGAKINLYTNNREDWILSPSFDLSTGGPYQLSVDAGLTNWNNTAIDSMGMDDTVQVLISTDAGVSWTALYTWDSSNEPPDTGTTVTVNLSAYSGTTNNFAIWASDGSSDDPEDYDFHIGNFAIETKPVCNEPSNMSATNVSSDTAFLAWVENGTATQWIIEYDTLGFTAGMGNNSVVVSTDTFTTISGLMAQISYDVYVRAICGPGDTSVWSNGVSFTTLTKPIPYYSIGSINTEDANGIADSLNVNSIISGTVTGVNRSASGFEFALIDLASGFQEGITVSSTSSLNYYTSPIEGDSLLIWGTVGQNNGLTQFVPDSISILKSGTAVVPTPELSNILDEGTESILIEMMDNYVLIDSSSTGSYTMRAVNGIDTISIRIDSNTDVDDSLSILSNTLVTGDTICGLIGIGSQFDSSNPYTEDYLIIPSRYADLSICRLSVGLAKNNSKVSTFSIAPNPTNGTFIIRTDGFNSETIRIQIRDLSGRIVFEENVRNSKGQFQRSMDISGNAKGIYFISLSDGTEVINQKMILK